MDFGNPVKLFYPFLGSLYAIKVHTATEKGPQGLTKNRTLHFKNDWRMILKHRKTMKTLNTTDPAAMNCDLV